MAAGVPAVTSRQDKIQKKKKGHFFSGFTLLIVISPFPEVLNSLTPQWPAGSHACPNPTTNEENQTTTTDLTDLDLSIESRGRSVRNLSKDSLSKEGGWNGCQRISHTNLPVAGRGSHSPICHSPLHALVPPNPACYICLHYLPAQWELRGCTEPVSPSFLC